MPRWTVLLALALSLCLAATFPLRLREANFTGLIYEIESGRLTVDVQGGNWRLHNGFAGYFPAPPSLNAVVGGTRSGEFQSLTLAIPDPIARSARVGDTIEIRHAFIDGPIHSDHLAVTDYTVRGQEFAGTRAPMWIAGVAIALVPCLAWLVVLALVRMRGRARRTPAP